MDTTKIKQYIDALPPLVRAAVLAPEWRTRIGEIGTKYSLHIDQISSLEYETLFVMIGMEPEIDFIGNIEKEVGVSKILAGQLAEEINDRIFKVVLRSIEEKSTPKAPRFVEENKPKPVPVTLGIPQVTPAMPKVSVIPKPPVINLKTMPVMHMDEHGLLSNIEKLSEAPAPLGRVVPPPANLPTDSVSLDQQRMEADAVAKEKRDDDMQVWADAARETSKPQQEVPQVIKSEIKAAITVTPIPQAPAAQPAPSLADVKLNNIIAVENSTTKTPYNDPYREPLE